MQVNILTFAWYIHGWTGLVIVEEESHDDHAEDHGDMLKKITMI